MFQRICCRFLISSELSNNPGFLAKNARFTSSIYLNACAIKAFPLGPFRDFLAWPLAFFHRRSLNAALEPLQPVVAYRLTNGLLNKKSPNNGCAEHKASDTQAESCNDTPVYSDAIDCIISLPTGSSLDSDPRQISVELLHNLWLGSLPVAHTVLQMLYQLLAQPEYLEPLRTEVAEMIEKYGWTEHGLRDLRLMDSFIREVGRVYPLAGRRFTCFVYP